MEPPPTPEIETLAQNTGVLRLLAKIYLWHN